MKTFEEYNKEVKKNIIDLWAKGGHSAKNMENDPIVNLLLTALAYQTFHVHKNIDQFEEKTFQELRNRIIPFHLLKPVPAFSIVETALKEGCEEKIIDETCSFEFANSQKQKFNFVPLLNTKIMNVELKIQDQLEKNVWRVELQSENPIENLSELSFFLDTPEQIEIESIRCDYDELPLIKPTQYNELPFTKWFNNAHLFLNQNYYLFGTYHYWQELFLTHNIPLYYIAPYPTKKTPLNQQTTSIELEITFNAPIYIDNNLKINCIPVVNVEKKEVSLDERNPVKDLTPNIGEFLNLLCDKGDEKDIENVMIRQHGVERYNPTQLFEQMQEMLYRYNSDYYAFQDIRELKSTDKLENLQNIIDEIRGIVHKSDEKMIKDHHYAVLKKSNREPKRVELKYLITTGTMANGIKKDEKATKSHIALDNNKTSLLLETKGGNNGVKNEAQKENIAKYYFQTKDRLITPADIIVFIKTFYHKDNPLGDEIENIAIKTENEYIGITIKFKSDTPLNDTDKQQLSEILQTKITLKSSGILPFRIHIL